MDSDADTDTVIGLDVRGQVFYCNKSKLLNANNGSSYFSARFREDSLLDAGLDRVDNEGQDIYKLDRDPSIFKHIMEYIDTAEKPIGISTYEMNKQLWGLVREEALYFGLDSLVQLLKITFSCSPGGDNGDQGIMYWLGTNKGVSDYTNPYSRRAVAISGWFEEEGNSHLTTKKDEQLMVQYRPNPEGEEIASHLEEEPEAEFHSDIFSNDFGVMMGCSACDSGNAGKSFNFHLLNGVSVSPTHYSIRNGGCYGMSGDWNLEAITDGTTWDVIHEARGKQSKLYGGVNDNNEFYRNYEEEYKECMEIWNMAITCEGTESRNGV